MDKACSTNGRIQKCIQSSSGKTWEKLTLMKTGCKWEDNIKMHLRKVVFEAGIWIVLAQDSDVMNLRVV